MGDLGEWRSHGHVGQDVWFGRDAVCCKIEHLSNVDEIWPVRYIATILCRSITIVVYS